MPDAAYVKTEKTVNNTKKKIKKVYDNAQQEIYDIDLDDLLIDKENATQKEKLEHAEKNDKLDKIIISLAGIILLANTNAIKIINKSLNGIYTSNFNEMKNDINNQKKTDIKQKNFNADMIGKYTKRAYERETQKQHVSDLILKEIKKGIKKGEGIAEIRNRIMRVANKSRNSANKIAFTETFRIANQSRMDCFENAAASGLHLIKIWHHSHASKIPRNWHLAMEGEEQELNEPFSNDLMYPVDPDGSAEETILCKCYMTSRVID